ncbi:hypothetical protein GCM10010211_82990 [Streptomyces albospinus]|uniref:Uncharacterized protein n=1 Tax=Streptomyces albospinus TaxID=285515 RepID=A0ABQ2VPG9_9ACTN|nr:hypothetical protein [Streptomyces albospinus]GGV03150.1 hypothetical protein GCM10010211_82990 [Streptomyces albospinus]
MNGIGTALLSEVQREALDEVLAGVPYNSASQFHEYFGTRAAPPRFGQSCAWQSFTVGRMVAERSGAGAEYLIDGRHVAAVYRRPEGLVILDPYLLHGEPLRLDRGAAVDGAVQVAVDAYPHRVRKDGTPAPSRVRATWTLDDDAIRLDYLRFSPRRGHNVASRSFVLRPESRLETVPPPADWVRPLLVHPEQHSVSVRVLHPATRRMAELILPLADRPAGVAGDSKLLITKDNQGAVATYGDARFERDLEVVADAVCAPQDEVIAFLLEAAAIHRSAAPAGLALAPYSLEDE